MQTLDAFLRDLASADPVPGGGSVAALQAAMGAALLAMVASLTIGKKRYQDVEAEAMTIRDRANALRRRAEELAEEDVQAFGHVSEAMTLPRETEEERDERRRRMQAALQGAAEPPLETMRVAAETITLARDLVRIGNRAAVSDVGVAALSARAGYHAARLNVEINLAAIKDGDWVANMRTRMHAIASPDDVEREVMAATESEIRGTGA